jgi:hypothetical protein
MKKDGNQHGAYVRRVREDTQRYAQDLLADNEKLRVLIASLEGEKSALSGQARMAEDVLEENEALRAVAASLEHEKLRLQEQNLRLRGELARHREEQAGLQERLANIEDESRQFSARYAEVEQENSNLANLYVASYRLHGTVERRQALAVIQEIVANLIGSEELAVFEMNPEGSALSLVGSFGIEPERHRTVRVGSGVIGRAVLSGETYVSNGGRAQAGLPQEADLTACIPLKLDDRVTGAIALFRLLPQKAGFEAVDRELFDLLATHAATALYCSGLHARLLAGTAAPA